MQQPLMRQTYFSVFLFRTGCLLLLQLAQGFPWLAFRRVVVEEDRRV